MLLKCCSQFRPLPTPESTHLSSRHKKKKRKNLNLITDSEFNYSLDGVVKKKLKKIIILVFFDKFGKIFKKKKKSKIKFFYVLLY